MTQRSPLSCILRLAALLCAVGIPPSTVAQPALRVFLARDYGAVPDGEADCGHAIRAAIRAAIASGPGAEAVLESGVYRVKPRALRETCFPIHQATNLVVRGLHVRFAPGMTRLLTANADGVHCQQNRSGPIIEDCYFEGMADDAINIYAPPNVVRELRSPTQWLVSPGALILPGDRLQVLDPRTGRLRGEVKVTGGKVEQRAFLIEADHAAAGVIAGADHRTGDTLYNLDGCGAGFRIRSNHMNGNRRYGCLLRAGSGMVEDDVFEDTSGAGVVLTNEPDWPEGPVPWSITIRRNRFLRGGHRAQACRSRHRRGSVDTLQELTPV